MVRHGRLRQSGEGPGLPAPPRRRSGRKGVVALELALRGAGGEPVDLVRTLMSHGLAELAPMERDETGPLLGVPLAVQNEKPRKIATKPGRKGFASIEVDGPAPASRTADDLLAGARHILRLDEDLSD